MNPIENREACYKCHDSKERLIGLLLTDISIAPLEKPLADEFRESLLWRAGAILVTVIIVNLIISRLVIRRIERVAQALAQFGRGSMDVRLPAERPDEIGQLAATFNEMGQRVQAEEAENQALSESLRHEATQRQKLLKRLITAQEEERQRVARDLHDDLGQYLAGLAAHLEAAERMISYQPEQARVQLRRTRALVAETTERAYDLILSLRPSALDDLGLVPAVRAHATRALGGSNIQFEIDSREFTRRLPPEIETALFRTFQEALSNVIRHAGAKQVCLKLVGHNGLFTGEIVDDGCGFDTASIRPNGNDRRGLGLAGMHERVAQCGGKLEIISQPGAGTMLRVRIPFPEIDDD